MTIFEIHNVVWLFIIFSFDLCLLGIFLFVFNYTFTPIPC